MIQSKLINFNGKIVDVNTIAGISKESENLTSYGNGVTNFNKKYYFRLKCITDVSFPLLTLNSSNELEIFFGDNTSYDAFYNNHRFIVYNSKLYDTEEDRNKALSNLYEYLKSYIFLLINDSPNFG